MYLKKLLAHSARSCLVNKNGLLVIFVIDWNFDPFSEIISDKEDFTETQLQTTEPLGSGTSDSSDSDDDLGTSASVQEEKREFEAGLSDLRHKLAQDVIIEEEEGKLMVYHIISYRDAFWYTILMFLKKFEHIVLCLITGLR